MGLLPVIQSDEHFLTVCVCHSYKLLKNIPAGGPTAHLGNQGTQCPRVWIHSAATSVCQLHGMWLAGRWVTDKKQNARCACPSPADGRRGSCIMSDCTWVPGRTWLLIQGRCPLARGRSGGGLARISEPGRGGAGCAPRCLGTFASSHWLIPVTLSPCPHSPPHTECGMPRGISS